MKWPRKHQYGRIGKLVRKGHDEVSIYCCRACGKITMLESWQLSSLPWKAARCPAGRYLWPWEALYLLVGGFIDCVVPTDESSPTLH